MPRKPVSEMTPDELEKYRAYMRKKKAESRKAARDRGEPPEVDTRVNRDRKEYNKEYYAKNKEYFKKYYKEYNKTDKEK